MDLPRIVAFGGYPGVAALEAVFELAGGRKVLYDTTASPPGSKSARSSTREVTHLSFHPWPPADLRGSRLRTT